MDRAGHSPEWEDTGPEKQKLPLLWILSLNLQICVLHLEHPSISLHLSTLIWQASICSEWWLTQRLNPGHGAENKRLQTYKPHPSQGADHYRREDGKSGWLETSSGSCTQESVVAIRHKTCANQARRNPRMGRGGTIPPLAMEKLATVSY